MLSNLYLDMLEVAYPNGKPINLSYSLLSSYKECQVKSLLTLVIDRSIVPFNVAYTIAGSTTAKMFETWFKKQYPYEWLEENLVSIFEGIERSAITLRYPAGSNGFLTGREYAMHKAKVALQALATTIIYDRKWTKSNTILERWVTHPTSNPRLCLKGSADVFELDTRIIWDIKVTTNASYGSMDQLTFYAALSYFADGRLPDLVGFIMPLLKNPYRRVQRIELPAVKSLLETMSVMGHRLTTGKLETTKNPSTCRMCHLKNFCPEFNEDAYVTRTIISNCRNHAPKITDLPTEGAPLTG